MTVRKKGNHGFHPTAFPLRQTTAVVAYYYVAKAKCRSLLGPGLSTHTKRFDPRGLGSRPDNRIIT